MNRPQFPESFYEEDVAKHTSVLPRIVVEHSAKSPHFKQILVLGDGLAFALSILTVFLVSQDLRWVFSSVMQSILFVTTTIVGSLFWIELLNHRRLYKLDVIQSRRTQMRHFWAAWIRALILYAAFDFFFPQILQTSSRVTVTSVFALLAISHFVWRFLAYPEWFSSRYSKSEHRRRTAIIGTDLSALAVASRIGYSEDHDMTIIGFFSDEHPRGTAIVNGFKVIGSTADIERTSLLRAIDTFIISDNSLDESELLSLTERCSALGVQTEVISEIFDEVLDLVEPEVYNVTPAVQFFNRHNSRFHNNLKRLVDVFFASVGLLILAPVFVAIILAVKLTSRGPAIFRQRRIGKDGKPFEFYKFRSMRVLDCEDGGDENTVQSHYRSFIRSGSATGKIINRKRVTSLGNFLRKTSLDELPQLWNVIKGDMSLVGPRPCLPEEFAHYQEWHTLRLDALPGLTGLWQISNRFSTGFREMVLLDYYYRQNHSFSLDISIMLRTLPVMLFGKNENFRASRTTHHSHQILHSL